MSKFNVGDRVKFSGTFYNREGEEGVVTRVTNHFPRALVEVEFDSDGVPLNCYDKELTLVEQEPAFKEGDRVLYIENQEPANFPERVGEYGTVMGVHKDVAWNVFGESKRDLFTIKFDDGAELNVFDGEVEIVNLLEPLEDISEPEEVYNASGSESVTLSFYSSYDEGEHATINKTAEALTLYDMANLFKRFLVAAGYDYVTDIGIAKSNGDWVYAND